MAKNKITKYKSKLEIAREANKSNKEQHRKKQRKEPVFLPGKYEPISNIKVGIGTDSHTFADFMDPENLFRLGGVEIKDVCILSNSDGDVIYHSLYNAISSAMGRSSIGKYYPNNPGPSRKFLEELKETMDKEGCSIVNISIIIEGKKPKILPIEDKIKKNIAEIFGISPEQIGITATTGENLTNFGLGKGIFAESVVSLEKY